MCVFSSFNSIFTSSRRYGCRFWLNEEENREYRVNHEPLKTESPIIINYRNVAITYISVFSSFRQQQISQVKQRI